MDIYFPFGERKGVRTCRGEHGCPGPCESAQCHLCRLEKMMGRMSFENDKSTESQREGGRGWVGGR